MVSWRRFSRIPGGGRVAGGVEVVASKPVSCGVGGDNVPAREVGLAASSRGRRNSSMGT